MNLEHAALRSEVAKTERELREAKISASGLRVLLSNENGSWKKIEEIDFEKIESMTREYCQRLRTIRELLERLKSLSDELNG